MAISFGELGSQLGAFGASAITAIFWVLAIGVFGGMLVGISLIIKQVRMYDITCRIYSKRHSGVKTWDQPGAFIKDKNTGNVFGFKIKGVDKVQKPIPYECLFMNDKGKNTVHLKQIALDKFEVLYPEFDWNEELNALPVIEESVKPVEQVQVPVPSKTEEVQDVKPSA